MKDVGMTAPHNDASILAIISNALYPMPIVLSYISLAYLIILE